MKSHELVVNEAINNLYVQDVDYLYQHYGSVVTVKDGKCVKFASRKESYIVGHWEDGQYVKGRSND